MPRDDAPGSPAPAPQGRTPGDPATPGLDGRGLLACALIHAGVALVLLWDAIASGFGRVVGSSSAELWAFLWGHFWMRQSLLVEHRWPYQTLLVDHPHGGVLWLKDPIMLVAMLPVQLVAGIPAAYTASQLSLFVLAGMGLFLLARELGLGRWPAILGSLAFAFAPHTLGEAFNGNIEALNTCWQPLWLWAMLVVLRRPGPATAAVAAAALWALLLTNQYWAIAMAAVSGPLVAQRLWRQRALGPPWRALAWLGAAVGTGLLLFAPAGMAIQASMAAADKINALTQGQVPLMPPYTTDLLHLLRPMAPLRWQTEFPPFQDLVYPGFLVLLGALAAPLLGPRGPWRWWWPAMGLGFLVLSLGPALSIYGRVVGAPDSIVWLPWAWLSSAQPLLRSMTLPHRMAVPAALFLALGLAATLHGLWGRGARGQGAAVAVLLGLGAMAEILIYPPYAVPLASTATPRADHARLLAELEQPGAVLNLPFDLGSHDQRICLWHQAVHGRPIGMTLRITEPPSIVDAIPLLWRVGGPARRAALDAWDPQAHPEDPWGVLAMRDAGYGFVVVHQGLLEQGRLGSLDSYGAQLEPVLGPPLILAEGTLIFALDPAAREPMVLRARALLGPDAVLGP